MAPKCFEMPSLASKSARPRGACPGQPKSMRKTAEALALTDTDSGLHSSQDGRDVDRRPPTGDLGEEPHSLARDLFDRSRAGGFAGGHRSREGVTAFLGGQQMILDRDGRAELIDAQTQSV